MTVLAATRPGLVPSLVRTMRPRQWIKNILVVAAPTAAGGIGHGDVALRTAGAMGIFVLASAGAYLVNDAIDVKADRLHPDKRHRPVASGSVPAPLAAALGAFFLAGSIGSAAVLAGTSLALVMVAYGLISVSYTLWLKHIPVVEMGCVASGFVLRAVAGGASVHIRISPWFAIVASAGALLIVAGKRAAELGRLEADEIGHRPVLVLYSAAYLRSIRIMAAAVAIMAYALWSFQRAELVDVGFRDVDDLLLQLSVVPFVLGVLSVELAMESGRGGAPEEIAMHDRGLQVIALVCVVLVVTGVYT